ncbi:MAG: DUF4387 domain-containing protein [Propionibacteriaceae bacterium]|jgi:hypothetical protein|nr:DUF4387 domain-containing protein [Propionibacteriaceae bacterium]
MATVEELARYVRSKNAGPFWVTLEIFCDDDAAYEQIKHSPNLTKRKVAELYGADPALVKQFALDDLRVVKFSYPRPQPSGHRAENDMHSGQQYIKLAEVEI